MKKNLHSIIAILLLFVNVLSAQYAPNFSVINKGVLPPPNAAAICSSSDPSTCATYDVSGMNWTLTGTTTDPFVFSYSPTASESGRANTIAGNLFETHRTQGDVCLTSPSINIAGAGNVTINLNVLRSGTGTYTTVPSFPGGTADQVEFKYILNGGAEISSGALTGGAGTNASWNQTVSGTTLQVLACMSQNSVTEPYILNTFTVSGGVALPITLSGFFAKLNQDKNVEITWQTATERNNAYFEVQHSPDGKTFESIKTVAGHGNSDAVYDYTALDTTPNVGVNYYRLKQFNKDGTFEYSNNITVYLRKSKQHTLTVSPNPFNDVLSVSFPSGDHTLVQVYDLLGKIVYTETLTTESTNTNLDLSFLAAGIYLVQTTSNGESTTQQVEKVK